MQKLMKLCQRKTNMKKIIIKLSEEDIKKLEEAEKEEESESST